MSAINREGVLSCPLLLDYDGSTYSLGTVPPTLPTFLFLFVFYFFLLCDEQLANPASQTATNQIGDANRSMAQEQGRAANRSSSSSNQAVCHTKDESELFW